MKAEYTEMTVQQQREQERIKAHEPHVIDMSQMPNLSLTYADPAPTGGMLYMAQRGAVGHEEYIVWNCHHGEALTNGYYTNDVWDAIGEYAKRQGR